MCPAPTWGRMRGCPKAGLEDGIRTGLGTSRPFHGATHESFFLLFPFLPLISGPDSPLDAVHTLHYVIAINMNSDNNCFISLM